MLETVSLKAQTRGVVVKSGDEFSRWDTVWLQGKLLTYAEGGDATLQWLAPMLFVDLYNDDARGSACADAMARRDGPRRPLAP